MGLGNYIVVVFVRFLWWIYVGDTMNNKEFKQTLKDCPRVVPVFMVKDATDQVATGEIVYWNWAGTLMSHRGEVKVKASNLNFIGYSPIINLDDHVWPNLAHVLEM